MGRNGLYPASVQPGIPRLGRTLPGWTAVTFGDVLKVISRPASLSDNATYRLVTARRSRGGIVLREEKKGREIRTKTQFYVKAGDFLISRRQIVHGGCGVVPRELDNAIVSNEYLVLHSNGALLQDYLRWLSHSVYFQQTCFHSSIGIHVEKMVFQPEKWFRFRVNLPPMREQKKIVAILGRWDNAIERTEQLLTAKQKLKRGLMQQLLSGKKRLGRMTKPWRLVQISEIAQCAAGGTPSTNKAHYWGGSIPWAQSGDVHQRVIARVNGRISEAGLENSSAKMFPSETVFVALAGQGKTRGTAAISAVPLSCNQSLAGLICDKSRCLPRFLFHNLSSRYQELRALSKGDGGRGGLTLGLIRDIKFPLPEMLEQKQIIQILDLADSELAILAGKLTALKRQRAALAQKLLTGQARVVA